jgi:hypothetical protein
MADEVEECLEEISDCSQSDDDGDYAKEGVFIIGVAE